MASRTVYRDRKTGKFVSKKIWKRSKAKGGKRYKREKVAKALREWFVSFSYSKKAKTRTLDFFVIAATREAVLPLIFTAIDDGADDNGFDLTWAQNIPWQESDVDEITGPGSRIKNKQKPRVEVH